MAWGGIDLAQRGARPQHAEQQWRVFWTFAAAALKALESCRQRNRKVSTLESWQLQLAQARRQRLAAQPRCFNG